MFPKAFIIGHDLLKNKLNKSDPVLRIELIEYVRVKFGCTEMFFNKIQSQLKKAGLISMPLESVDGTFKRSKSLLKAKDVTVLELYEILCGPYPTGEIEDELKIILRKRSTK